MNPQRPATGRGIPHRLWRPAFLAVLLAACLPGAPEATPSAAPAPTLEVTESASSTPTVVWFPPTATATRMAAAGASATAFPLPPLGELLLHDDFSDAGPWSLFQGARGGASISGGVLSIVLNEPGAYVSASRTDLFLSDFYLEVTLATSLCAGQDEYGLLLRAASPSDFYRFSLSCDGRYRLDLIRGGTATSPLPWAPSAAVPRNAPAMTLLGVWAQGGDMHIYLDGIYQVSAPISAIPGGTLGFFARSGGANAVTVNFLDLSVWSLSP